MPIRILLQVNVSTASLKSFDSASRPQSASYTFLALRNRLSSCHFRHAATCHGKIVKIAIAPRAFRHEHRSDHDPHTGAPDLQSLTLITATRLEIVTL